MKATANEHTSEMLEALVVRPFHERTVCVLFLPKYCTKRDFRAEAALAEVSEEHEKTAMLTAARATTVFTASEIRVACDGFSPKKLIGRGVRQE